jgi:quercetin dioxygenase-like cupin family protein
MSNNEMHETLAQIDTLFNQMRKSFSVLSVQIGNVISVANISINEFTELPDSGGLLMRKMPNLHDDDYSVVEVVGKPGAKGVDVSVVQQVTITVMKGKINLKIGEEDWISCTPTVNHTITLRPKQYHQYEIIEDYASINIFTPALP